MSVHLAKQCLSLSSVRAPSHALVSTPKSRARIAPLRVRAAAAAEEADNDDGLTGEWPVNWSLASYEDVGEFFQNSLFKDSASPGNSLRDIMNTDLTYIFPDTKIEDLDQTFAKVIAHNCLI